MGILSTIAEGGQTWAHRMRMLRQLVKIAVISAILLGTSFFAYKVINLDRSILFGGWYHVKAKVYSEFTDRVDVDKRFWAVVSHELYSKDPSPSCARVQKVTQPYFSRFLHEAKHAAVASGWASLLGVAGFFTFFLLRGARTKSQHHLSGRKLMSPWRLSWQLRLKREASEIRLGSLPLVKGTETQHTLITGGTGSGKTNCVHHLFAQINNSRQKTLVVDTTGVYVDRYYNSAKDFILSPFDSRGAPWHPWIECKNSADLEELAECFIPRSVNDNENYWRIAAKSLFSSVLKKTESEVKTSILQDWLLTRPLDELAEFVQGTKAAAHIDLSSPKTAASIRSVASSFLGCLEYITDTKNPFSIVNWMQSAGESKLFLLAKPAQRSALGPLLSCWLSLAFRALLQLNPDLNRRIWFVLDELPTLNKVRDLESFLAEGRKYGGCGLLTLQSPSQMDSIYGHDVTKTIIGNCATKIVFSEQDPIIADLISRSFGEREILEYQESISYGANTMRDGVSLAESRKRLPLVSSSEIQALKKNQAFVKLPGSLPVTKIRLQISK